MKEYFYIAYGSNLNLQQMIGYRCPDSRLIATGMLQNYELLFRGRQGNCYCTISPCNGAQVPVGVFKISEKSLCTLDRYEGYPTHYHRIKITPSEIHFFRNKVKLHHLFVYVMNEQIGEIGAPSQHYFNVVLQGYRDCNLDQRYLYNALNKSIRASNRNPKSFY